MPTPLLGTFIVIVRSLKGLLNPAAPNQPTSAKLAEVQKHHFLAQSVRDMGGPFVGRPRHLEKNQ